MRIRTILPERVAELTDEFEETQRVASITERTLHLPTSMKYINTQVIGYVGESYHTYHTF